MHDRPLDYTKHSIHVLFLIKSRTKLLTISCSVWQFLSKFKLASLTSLSSSFFPEDNLCGMVISGTGFSQAK